ncbi:MAG: hypothetical protein DRJ67_04035, partial [Thermoprotei archaeon]
LRPAGRRLEELAENLLDPEYVARSEEVIVALDQVYEMMLAHDDKKCVRRALLALSRLRERKLKALVYRYSRTLSQ